MEHTRKLSKIIPSRVQRYLAAAAGCAAVMTALAPFRGEVSEMTVVLLLLLVVALVSAKWGRLPGLLAALLAIVCVNYFLEPPMLTLRIGDGQLKDLIALAVFLVTALVVDQLSARMKIEDRLPKDQLTSYLVTQILRRHDDVAQKLAEAGTEEAAFPELEREALEKDCYHLKDLARRIDETRANLEGKIQAYKWLGMIVLLLVPLMSAVISLLLTEDSDQWRTLATRLSWTVTICTLLNTIFRPADRFKEVCEMGISVQSIKDDFVAFLESVPHCNFAKKNLLSDIERYEAALFPHERRLIEMFLPNVSLAPSRRSRGAFNSGNGKDRSRAQAKGRRNSARVPIR